MFHHWTSAGDVIGIWGPLLVCHTCIASNGRIPIAVGYPCWAHSRTYHAAWRGRPAPSRNTTTIMPLSPGLSRLALRGSALNA